MSEKELEVQRHGMMYLISSAGITLVGFLATMFYAHWVGAGVLGQYFLFLSYFAIAGLFTDLGIGYAATYRICEGTDPDRYFSASLVIRLALWVIVAGVMLISSNHFGALNQKGLLWILIAVLGISTMVSSLGTAIGASNRLGLAASVSLIDNITRIIIQVIAVFLGFQVYGLIGGLVAGLLTEIVIDIKYIDYHLRMFNWSHVRSIFSFSSWVFLLTICTILFDNTNPIIIAYFLPVSFVGIFGVCWTFSVFALFVSTALCNTLYVKVSRWNSLGDKNAIISSLSRATTYSLIFALPILAGGILLGKDLLYYLYGASFAAGATALIIIIGARIVQSIFQLYSNFLMATDHARMAFNAAGAGITANIILSVIFVPVIGLEGAAIGSLANIVVSIFIGWCYLRRVIPVVFEWKPVTHIVTATAIMTGMLVLVQILPVGRSAFITGLFVFIGAIIYFAVLLKIDNQIREDALRTLKIKWLPP
jgi:O-antigen/teichoic acid export membrane protein